MFCVFFLNMRWWNHNFLRNLGYRGIPREALQGYPRRALRNKEYIKAYIKKEGIHPDDDPREPRKLVRSDFPEFDIRSPPKDIS